MSSPKSGNAQDSGSNRADQGILKLADGHTITYQTIGDIGLPLMVFVTEALDWDRCIVA